ncbi:efflux transporter outer membrane subunit [Methylosoma difficile]
MKRRGIVSMALLLSACMVGPDYQKPNLTVPASWQGSPPAAGKLPEAWWRSFNDPILNALIRDAIAANLDLKQALLKVQDLRAQRQAVFASTLPSLDAHSNASRRLNNTSGGSGSAVGGGFGVGSQIINIFQSGFDAQWELDFFGGVRRAVEVADATIEAEQDSRRAAQVTVLGEVARHYFELRRHQQLLAVLRQQLASQQTALALNQVRQQSGLADQVAVTQSQAQIAALQAQIPVSETAVRQANDGLCLLLGVTPGQLDSRLMPTGKSPFVGQNVIPDLPSELLKRRPDIRRAERNLAAATANIGIATAELYPKVNLSAFLGLQNMRISDMTPIGKSWSTAASVTLPIFNWGRINTNIASKKIQTEQAYLTYQSTVLAAFKDVQDALVAYQQEQQRLQALQQAVTAQQTALQLAQQRYQTGLSNFLEVLQNQQNLYQSQADAVSSQAQMAVDLVALYKALGGGWQGLGDLAGKQ